MESAYPNFAKSESNQSRKCASGIVSSPGRSVCAEWPGPGGSANRDTSALDFNLKWGGARSLTVWATVRRATSAREIGPEASGTRSDSDQLRELAKSKKKTRKNDAHKTPGAQRGMSRMTLVPIILAMIGSMGEQPQR